ncbi:hypothetical protein NL108_017703 [Boleophthalmus pectinirostris]|nr:hypothetical protein NL108_017703 [Boleophthalmus pectinirostris]
MENSGAGPGSGPRPRAESGENKEYINAKKRLKPVSTRTEPGENKGCISNKAGLKPVQTSDEQELNPDYNEVKAGLKPVNIKTEPRQKQVYPRSKAGPGSSRVSLSSDLSEHLGISSKKDRSGASAQPRDNSAPSGPTAVSLTSEKSKGSPQRYVPSSPKKETKL